MQKQSRIKQLLDILALQTEPISLAQLQASFANESSERSLRRWLQEAISQGLVKKTGQYKNTRYQLVTRKSADGRSTDAEIINDASIFSKNSLALIEHIRSPLSMRDPCSYNESWLYEYEPNKSSYLTKQQKLKLLKQGKQLLEEMPAGTYAKQIYNRLLIDLSYNSSRLEGNTYSLLETEKLLLEGTSATDKPDSDKIMIINHKEAIKFLVDGINRIDISLGSIQSLHYLLADGLVAAHDAGQIRNEVVRISATTYIPFEGKDRLTQLLTVITDKANKILNPFEQSFFLLVHLSYLQAFIDVNKRTARLAANIPLVRENLVPISFNDIGKDNYISALIAVYELNNISPLAELYTWGYSRSCKLYSATAQAMGIDILRVRYRQQRRTLIAEVIRKHIVGKAIKNYVHLQTEKIIPEEHRRQFINTVLSDLESLEPFKLAGMGISAAELKEWQNLNRN